MRNEGHLSEEILNMYLDGELHAEKREHVEVHLITCGKCRAEMAALQQLFVALEELAPAPAPDVVPGVLAHIHPCRRLPGSSLLRSRSLWLIPALQAIAALVLLAWGWAWLTDYWAVASDILSPSVLGDAWAEICVWVTAQWGGLSAWATALWATLPTWSDIHWWSTRLPTSGGMHLPPALGATLTALWLMGNTLLLRRALLNDQISMKEVLR